MNRKLTENELKEVKNIRDSYTVIKSNLGELDMQISFIEDQLNLLKQERSNNISSFKNIMKNEEELAKSLSNKYGQVKIDLDSGEITE